MDHSYFQDLLSAYLDNELTPEQQEAVRRHLEQCESCRRELQRLRQIDRIVDEHSQLDGDEYWEQSARKIEERLGFAQADVTDIRQSGRRQWSGLGWKIPAIAASVAILAFIGLHQSDIFRGSAIRNESVKPMPEVIEEKQSDTPALIVGDREEMQAEIVTLGTSQAKSMPSPSAPSVVNEQPVRIEAAEGVAEESEERHELQMATDDVRPETEDSSSRIFVRSGRSTDAATAPIQIDPNRVRYRPSVTIPDQILEDTLTDKGGDYKKKTQQMIYTESDDARATSVQPAEGSRLYGVSETEQLVTEELAFWRGRRDSLQAGNDSVSTEAVQTQLVEAWFRVCQLSADSVEVQTGVDYLNEIAADSASTCQAQAVSSLRRLGRR